MAWVLKAGLRSELGLRVGPEEQREQRDASQPPPHQARTGHPTEVVGLVPQGGQRKEGTLLNNLGGGMLHDTASP